MNYAKAALIFLLGCAAPSGPGLAQVEVPLGSRVGRPEPADAPDKRGLSDEDRALRTTLDYAGCLVQYDGNEFRPLLSLEPKDLNKKQQRALERPACLRHGELRMPMQILRGAIFRVFYLKDWAERPIEDFSSPVDYFEHVDRQYPDQVIAASMLDFASCVVRSDPASTRAFVSELPGEAESEAALKALTPRLGPCMRERLEVRLSKSILLAYLSEALYWEAKAAGEAAVES